MEEAGKFDKKKKVPVGNESLSLVLGAERSMVLNRRSRLFLKGQRKRKKKNSGGVDHVRTTAINFYSLPRLTKRQQNPDLLQLSFSSVLELPQQIRFLKYHQHPQL